MAEGISHAVSRVRESVATAAVNDRQTGFPPPCLAATSQGAGRNKRFAPKDIIYHKNDPADRVYLIRSGLVKLLSFLPNGQVRIVRLDTRDQWIGYEGLMGNGYWHTAVAVDTTEALCFQTNSLQEMEQQQPDQFGPLLRRWCDDLVQADHWISDFSTGEIRPRVARLVQYLAQLEYGEPLSQVKLLTVHEMAEILGVTQESVSRILASFKRNCLLQKQLQQQKQGPTSREVYLLDREKLSAEALR